MKLTETHIIPSGIEGVRLSDYAGGIFEIIPSRKGVKKAIDKGFVFVNDQAASTGKYIQTGDRIDLYLPEDFKKIYEFPVEVIYEDELMAVVNKPSGMLTNGNAFKTLENALPFNLQPSTAADAIFYPQVTHRLDYPTSGILLVAKTRSANTHLKQQFENRTIHKTYHALTIGKMNLSEGMINSPVNGKEAESHYKVVQAHPSKKYEFINLVELKPYTGRRHQLRIHLASIGHPILGDRDYGEAVHWDMHRGLYLAATAINFQHPVSKEEMSFSIELPKKFQKLLK